MEPKRGKASEGSRALIDRFDEISVVEARDLWLIWHFEAVCELTKYVENCERIIPAVTQALRPVLAEYDRPISRE